MEQELGDETMGVLRKCFGMFQSNNLIENSKIRTILTTIGAKYVAYELEATIEEHDPESVGKMGFENFVKVASHFLEEQDEEAMQKELKEAFRLYDKEGNGFIPTSSLKEILAALDDKLTSDDLDNIIEEIDGDGSGTVDFDEFMEMMTEGKKE